MVLVSFCPRLWLLVVFVGFYLLLLAVAWFYFLLFVCSCSYLWLLFFVTCYSLGALCGRIEL